MNKKLILIGALIVVGIIAIGLLLPSALKKRDLDRLCVISQEMISIVEKDRAFGLTKFSERTKAELISPDVKDILASLNEVAPEQRADLMSKGLTQLGFPEWQCPEFYKIYPPSSAPSSR